MQIYHVETQEDYDAFREYIKGEGLEYLRSDTKAMEYEDSCNTKYFGVFKYVQSCDLDWFEEHFPDVSIQKYKAKQNDVESSIEQVTQNNAELFHKIITDLEQTYLAKNKDYGNSFEESLNEYGEVAGLVRIGDKLNRAKNLSKNKANVKDESKIDTYLDMANYNIMQAMWLMKQEG